jgi:hypothetical protein
MDFSEKNFENEVPHYLQSEYRRNSLFKVLRIQR